MQNKNKKPAISMGTDGGERRGARGLLRSEPGGWDTAAENQAARGECRDKRHASPSREGHGPATAAAARRGPGRQGARAAHLPLSCLLTSHRPPPSRGHRRSSFKFLEPVRRSSLRPGRRSGPAPGFCRSHPAKAADEPRPVGVGTTAHGEGPSERRSKVLKSQLLEREVMTTSSLQAKCVCHYARLLACGAPAPGRTARALRGAGARSPSPLTGRTNRSGAPRTLAPAWALLLAPQPPPPGWVWPRPAAGAAPSSNHLRSAGAMCTGGLLPRCGRLPPSPARLPRPAAPRRSTPPAAAPSRQTAGQE